MPVPARAEEGKKHALLVGIRQYRSGKFEPLRYTENDVEELAKVLGNEAGFSSVRVLTSTRGTRKSADAPTVANVRAALKTLLAGKGREDTVLVALSGHGIQARVKEAGKEREDSFFCPSDAQLNDNDSLLSLGKLFADLDDCGAGVKLLLVDACRNDPRLGRNVDVDTLPRLPRGTAALFSCKSGERAFETPRLGRGHGVFFYHVLEGLRGKARNSDGEVTWLDLSRYVTRNVSRGVPVLIGGGARQTPELKINHTGESPVLVTAGTLRKNEARPADFFFRDGETVVMIGDSITEQHLYSNYVETWAATRFPAWKLTFRNTGMGGDTARGGNARFKRDVLSYKPTAMTVALGMNDGGYKTFNESRYREFLSNLQGMADQAKAAKVRVVWLTPHPMDPDEQGKTALAAYNQTLEKFSAGVGEIAQKNGGLFIDRFHPYLAVLDRARAASPKYTRIGGGDAVHPAMPGHALLAALILKGLHFPTLVSSVEIDASGTPKETATKRCRVSDLAAKGGGVSFQRLDEALPFFPPEASSILKWSPVLEELNDYRLKVTGLKGGSYEVRLGGKKVAVHSAEELARGVNLAAAALKEGPIADQAKAVAEAIKKKNQHHHDQVFRGVVVASALQLSRLRGTKLTPSEVETTREALVKERMAKMPELEDAVHKALEMKAYAVDVVPVR
jgi:lysophospholipase L1-like esterase